MRRFFKFFFFFCLTGLLITVSAVGGMYWYVKDELPSVNVLKDIQLQTPMKVFTADGKLISQFGEKKRIPVTLDEVPQQMIDALIATEDARFYEHNGVDFVGLIRSAVAVISAGGRRTQGASTLTMQLARNFFLTREKTYMRKIKEIFIAFHIENLLSKNEILTLYLNKNELGNRAFGVGATAEVLYGKTVAELTLPQTAMIIGLHKAPSAYNPLRNPTRAAERRNIVLWRMKDAGYIDQSTYQNAIQAPITAQYHGAQIEVDAPYIAEMVRQFMIDTYGTEIAYTRGYEVYTTVSASAQQAAQNALRNNLHAYDERHGYRGADKKIWDPTEETAWSTTEIIQFLRGLTEYGDVKRAVVTQLDIDNNSFEFTDKYGNTGTVNWENANWARPYISDTAQGKEPNSIIDVVTEGDLIYIRAYKNSWRLAQLPKASAAFVSIDPNNGAIKALMGGYDFRQSEYNRATQAKRQVGSNIKPFIYSAALENGFTLASVINDAPINQWDRRQGIAWRPKNSPPVYDGPIRIRQALAKSKNVVSVRLLRSVGVDKIVEHLTRFGFSPHEIPKNESLALGSASFTPLEVVTAFSAFSNAGHIVTPFVVDRVQQEDEVIWQANPALACLQCRLEAENTRNGHNAEQQFKLDDQDTTFDNKSLNRIEHGQTQNDAITHEEQRPYLQAPQAISEQNAYLIHDAMQSAIWGGGDWRKKTGWNGTAWRAQTLKRRDIGGKTGTTNDAKDAWFTGFTSTEVITSWVGFDDHRRVLGQSKYNNKLGKNQIYGKEFGAKTALPAWIEYVNTALKDKEHSQLTAPASLVTVRIDRNSGKLTTKTNHTARFEYFISGTEPTQFADVNPNPDVLNAELKGEVIDEQGGIF